jgi:hypothetical protein
MPRNPDPVAAAYVLKGDGTELGFVLNPTFLTVNSVGFQISANMLKLFADRFGPKKGCLPFQNLSLVILDYSLHEMARYSWSQAMVTEIDFPGLDLTANKLINFFVWLSVVTDTRSTPAQKPRGSASSQPKGRIDPLACFLFRLRIDGLEPACDAVSTIDAFTVTLDGAGSLVLGMAHEGSAEPFRDWLNNDNSPKSGTLEYLDTHLRTFFTLNFTGLRVQTVAPAITTYSASPATITLSYTSIGVAFPIVPLRTQIWNPRQRR